MAQYDLHLVQNNAVTGIEFDEMIVNITRGGILTASADANRSPRWLSGGTEGQIMQVDESGDLVFVNQSAGHAQNTDTGTTASSFNIDSDGTGVKLKNNTSELQLRNLADNAYADLVVKNLTVFGTTATINSTTVTVDDKNIELGAVDTPSDITADGGGITLKGATDKTIIWDNGNDNWTLNQNVNIPTGSVYKINNVEVLSTTQVLGVTLGTMAAESTADYQAVLLEGAFVDGDKNKLDGIESGATADQNASEVLITDAGGYFTGIDVEAALQEAGLKLDGIESGATADQDAVDVPVADAGTYYVGTNVEAVLQEIGADLGNIPSVLTDLDTTVTGTELNGIKTKVDGIEALADVTDSANVNAAGAVMESDYNANTILAATTDNTPITLAVAEQTIIGRKTGGAIAALTPAEIMNVIVVTAPATKTSTGTAGQIAFDDDYFYRCSATNVWKRSPLFTNW